MTKIYQIPLSKKVIIFSSLVLSLIFILLSISLYTQAGAATTINCDNGYTRDVDDNGNTIPGTRHPTTCSDLGTCGDDDDDDYDYDGPESCSPRPITCTSAPNTNICGFVGYGSGDSCSGCSASPPADPSGTCSVATACGVAATGFNGCGGCNITNYPSCEMIPDPECTDPLGCPLVPSDDIDWISIDGAVTDVVAEIFAKPAIVKRGTSSSIIWLSLETTSCEVTGDNGDYWGPTEVTETLGGATNRGHGDYWGPTEVTETSGDTTNRGHGDYLGPTEVTETLGGTTNRGHGPSVFNNFTNQTITQTITRITDRNKFGEERTSNLTSETTYNLSCTGYDGSIVEDSVTVKILPVWQEI